MANQEVDKIADLKKQVDDEQNKEASRKEEEKEKLAKMKDIKKYFDNFLKDIKEFSKEITNENDNH